MTTPDLKSLAALLTASGQYKVLRRLEHKNLVEPANGAETRLGLFIDVETTGLDPGKDEIIELAMVPFTYGLDGRIFEIRPPFQKFRDPGIPIPEEITLLTGITDAMVAGQKIDPAEVAAFAVEAALVIAHNATFDRRFVERLSEAFVTKPWACSMSQIAWSAEGLESTKLTYLAMGAGFFYERHRAVSDCIAAIELLITPLPKTGVRAMTQLLENARRASWRIWAENAPFDKKDALKARGYRWNGDGTSHPRAWYVDVDEGIREPELAFLKTEIYKREIELPTKKLTAYERFSIRS